MKHFLLLISTILLLSCVKTQTFDNLQTYTEEAPPVWELISSTTTATVYNAVPSQCNSDVTHTASMFVIVPEKIEENRILAMERTMMKQFNIHYGDMVMIEGTDKYDGLWQVQDTMNKRYAGQHKIDFLVPKGIRYGKWENVRVYRQIKV